MPKTSLRIFRDHIVKREDGSLDASGVISSACFEMWCNSRKSPCLNSARQFQRSLSAHLAALDGRLPFSPAEEAAVLVEVRRREVWPCFKEAGNGIMVGSSGFRSWGFHEKTALVDAEKAAAEGGRVVGVEDAPPPVKRNRTEAAKDDAGGGVLSRPVVVEEEEQLFYRRGLPVLRPSASSSSSSCSAPAAEEDSPPPQPPPAFIPVNQQDQSRGAAASAAASTVTLHTDEESIAYWTQYVMSLAHMFDSSPDEFWTLIGQAWKYVLYARTSASSAAWFTKEKAHDLCAVYSDRFPGHFVSVSTAFSTCFSCQVLAENAESVRVFGSALGRGRNGYIPFHEVIRLFRSVALAYFHAGEEQEFEVRAESRPGHWINALARIVVDPESLFLTIIGREVPSLVL